MLHCQSGKVFFVGKNSSVCRSLLTRKNLTNAGDVKTKTLYSHVLDVRKNFTKMILETG